MKDGDDKWWHFSDLTDFVSRAVSLRLSTSHLLALVTSRCPLKEGQGEVEG